MPDAVLHCGDCLEWMRGQPDDSVDLVCCSPPYEAARLYAELGFSLRGDDWVDWAVKRFVECVRVCKGMVCWVVEGQTRDYRWSATPALMMARLHRAGVHLRKPPAFYRVGIPGSGGPDWFRNDYEFIVCGSKGGKLPWSDNTACGHPPKWGPGGEMSNRQSDGTRRNQWGGSASRNGSSNERKRSGKRGGKPRPSHVLSTIGESRARAENSEDLTIIESRAGTNGPGPAGSKGGKKTDRLTMTRPREGAHTGGSGYNIPVLANPGNAVRQKYTADEVVSLLMEAGDFRRFIVGGGVMGSELAHENEAPFPEDLADFLIRSLCPPGGIVFDPFSGSGTTGAVALRTGRSYVGIDVRESQIELTRRRLAEVQGPIVVKPI